MIKKFNGIIMSLLFACSMQIDAKTIQTFKLGVGLPYVLTVNEPLVINNPIVFTIKASCTLASDNESNLLSFTVLKKSGTFNGTKIVKGETMTYIAHNSETINITALPGAQVELTNQGEETIEAECSIS